jgi:hypothetical protein
MTSTRHRNAWMWLAVAAMAVVSLARIEANGNNAAYANTVLAFLAGQQDGAAVSAGGSPQIVQIGSARRGSGMYLHDASSGAWMAVLPVLFVGLVSPLSLISPRAIHSLGRAPQFPALPEKFQRPPPPVLL